jgi:hypothetical protein
VRIDAAALQYAGAGTQGVFHIDHMTASWSPAPVAAAPRVAALTASGSLYSTTVTAAESVSVTLNRAELPFTHNTQTGLLSVRVPDIATLGVLKVTARNAFGDYAAAAAYIRGTDTPPLNPPADIAGHYWERELLFLEERGLLDCAETDGERLFEPDRPVTRFEMTKMLVMTLGADITPFIGAPSPFADVDDPYITAARALGLVGGVTGADGNVYFMPERQSTRADIATLFAGALPKGMVVGELTFADAADIPAYAKNAVAMLHNNGIVGGVGGNRFAPLAPMPRSNMAVLLVRMFF